MINSLLVEKIESLKEERKNSSIIRKIQIDLEIVKLRKELLNNQTKNR